ncbi:MAG: hypothetical protein ACOYNL_05510 [Rickettsiales bacterium]
MRLLANIWMIACIYVGWLQWPFIIIPVLGVLGAVIESNIRMPEMRTHDVPRANRTIERFLRRLLDNMLVTTGLYISGYIVRYCYVHYL